MAQLDRNRALAAGELDWKIYIRPKDLADLDECRSVDQFNDSIYVYNNSMLPRINELRLKMGEQKYKLEPPPKYTAQAQARLNELMRKPDYRMIAAVGWLYQRGKVAVRDYEMTDGPTLADKMAEEEEIERLVDAGPIDITDAAGRSHKNDCTCENRWDGTSARCIGEGVRLRWVRHADHHFLRPHVKPEAF